MTKFLVKLTEIPFQINLSLFFITDTIALKNEA